jgi:Opioid growth factor receptor (OGFr) conserved region
MSQLLEFYQGRGLDSEGRTLAQVWDFSDEEMEDHHDFIQWLFPLREPSQHNPNAPLLTEADIAAFRADPTLGTQLLRSFDRFLEFVGLVRHASRIEPGLTFTQKREVWLIPNHNWLRLTRVLHCLRILGLEEESQQLFSCLDQLNERGAARITPSTLSYWKNATFPGRP